MFIVGGTFDNDGGKSSFIVKEMMEFLGCPGINGGNLNDLDIDFSFTDSLIWMPNISNKEDKILPTIKVRHPHMLLVQSKVVSKGNYTDADIVGRLLKSHSLLGIVIEKKPRGYKFRVLDPLGNIHCSTYDLEVLCRTLKNRTDQIKKMTRVGSKSIGPVKDFTVDYQFIEIVKNLGTQFAAFVNAINPNRLLGNASTRCSAGFPAVRDNERLFVSKRNVDKQTLSSEDFVEVGTTEDGIEFFGDNKPSVDSPIQLLLLYYYPNIKYMVHGHVYVKDAPMTENKIPCGFLEEVTDVVAAVPDLDSKEFVVNLRGHGCLIACSELSYFDEIELMARPFPEK